MEVKRINDICPCCGLNIKTMYTSMENERVTYIRIACSCGFSAQIDDNRMIAGDPIDRWNKLAERCHDGDLLDQWNKSARKGRYDEPIIIG